MRIDVYRDFKPAEIITVFNNLSASVKWRGSGTFKLEISSSEVYRNLVGKTDFFIIDGECYLLESKSKEDSKKERRYTLEGQHINCLISRRIATDLAVTAGANYETVALALVTANFISPADSARAVDNLIVKRNGITKTTTIAYTVKAGTVDSMLNDLLSNAGLGWRVFYDIEQRQFVFEILQGRDLSNSVIFGDKFNNIANAEIYEQSGDLKNVGYTYYEGTLTAYGDTVATGWERRELIVKGDSLGTALLSDAKEVIGAEFDVKKTEQYVYKADYKLGDTVRFVDNDSNLQAIRPVLEVEQFWENTHDIALTFGDSRPTILDKLRK